MSEEERGELLVIVSLSFSTVQIISFAVWVDFFYFFFSLVEDFNAGNYFYPSVPFLTGKKLVRAFGLQLCLQKNSVVVFGLVLYGFPKKKKKEKKGNEVAG